MLHYFVRPLSTNMGSLMITQDLKTTPSRKLVIVARLRSGIRIFRLPALTASLFGSVTWADVGEMEAVKLAIKRMVLSCPDPTGCAFSNVLMS